ncbi:aminotransferase class I/II-fold pyridoxal phosphate-dependent enzyme [Tepidanaerobacter sp. EBM-49]|uniref:trans-sulfuration enzyme family protein n=1 Tax=Tepidanaerobacter sp. EBM-49 TaxID=1918504 RepID=UPI000A42A54F|nr:aminotransferase class I/II-fold pyridoxal phosphate-dependent enzyme [Tepidanaerobacter sp. EBM-49]
MNKKYMTKLTHTGEKVMPSVSAPKVPPIYMSSVFSFDSVKELDEVYEGTPGYVYSRMGNPNHDSLEEILATIDEGEDALVYSSGMGAISMSLLANIKSQDHIISSNVLYGGTWELLTEELKKFNVEVTFLDFNKDDIEPYFKPNTKVVYMETISNPLMEVADIRKIAKIAHQHNAKLIVDNTFATPVVCQPLKLGADIVVYSLTKYMGGHSDVIGGGVVSDKETIENIRHVGSIYGPTMSPFDAWLITRSLRTLELRMRQHSQNAMKLAEYLENHKKVKKVYYPGLASSPSKNIAEEIFYNGLFGGMMSVDLVGEEEEACKFIDSLEKVKLVPSLAGVTTTMSYPAKTSHRSMSRKERQDAGISDSLLRISVGLEEIEDIIEEFNKAFEKI